MPLMLGSYLHCCPPNYLLQSVMSKMLMLCKYRIVWCCCIYNQASADNKLELIQSYLFYHHRVQITNFNKINNNLFSTNLHPYLL